MHWKALVHYIWDIKDIIQPSTFHVEEKQEEKYILTKEMLSANR